MIQIIPEAIQLAGFLALFNHVGRLWSRLNLMKLVRVCLELFKFLARHASQAEFFLRGRRLGSDWWCGWRRGLEPFKRFFAENLFPLLERYFPVSSASLTGGFSTFSSLGGA